MIKTTTKDLDGTKTTKFKLNIKNYTIRIYFYNNKLSWGSISKVNKYRKFYSKYEQWDLSLNKFRADIKALL